MVINICVRIFQDFPDNVVASGGLPISFGLTVISEIIDDRPRIEYF